MNMVASKIKYTSAHHAIFNANIRLAYKFAKTHYAGVRTLLDYDDFESQVMEALLRACRGFKPELGFRLSTYAWRCMLLATARLANPKVLKRKRHYFNPSPDKDGSVVGIVDEKSFRSHEMRESKELVAKVLPRLNEQQRQVVHLRFFAGLTLEESAQLFGLTKERIRQIQIAALRKAKEVLDPKH